jgi:hypothetical protein
MSSKILRCIPKFGLRYHRKRHPEAVWTTAV